MLQSGHLHIKQALPQGKAAKNLKTYQRLTAVCRCFSVRCFQSKILQYSHEKTCVGVSF